MKAFFITILLIGSIGIANAQKIKLYEAKVFTSKGVTKGVLERVYSHGVGIYLNNDVSYIDAADIKKIEVKRFSYSFGKKLLGAALIGSMLALNDAKNVDDQISANVDNPAYPDHHQLTLADQSGYAAAGALLGGLAGAAIPSPRKEATFKIEQNSEAFSKVFTEFSQYGRYNQLLANRYDPLPPLTKVE